jgi:hypothetical protein
MKQPLDKDTLPETKISRLSRRATEAEEAGHEPKTAQFDHRDKMISYMLHC